MLLCIILQLMKGMTKLLTLKEPLTYWVWISCAAAIINGFHFISTSIYPHNTSGIYCYLSCCSAMVIFSARRQLVLWENMLVSRVCYGALPNFVSSSLEWLLILSVANDSWSVLLCLLQCEQLVISTTGLPAPTCTSSALSINAHNGLPLHIKES